MGGDQRTIWRLEAKLSRGSAAKAARDGQLCRQEVRGGQEVRAVKKTQKA